MKIYRQEKKYLPQIIEDLIELLQIVKTRHPKAFMLFLALSFNLLLAPAIYAATGTDITRKTAYALGILGIVIMALSIYLFFVIFQPEKF